jgi:hypothetical protein
MNGIRVGQRGRQAKSNSSERISAHRPDQIELDQFGTLAEQKRNSPFNLRAIKIEIVGGLDALLSDAACGWVTGTPVREGSGSGGGT